MSGGLIVVDISKESPDPCKNFIIDFLECSKGKSKEERQKECFYLGSNYIHCKTDPKNFKIKTKKETKLPIIYKPN